MSATGIYASILSTANQRVVAYLDWLDQQGQIDRDANGDPFVIRIERPDDRMIRVFVRRDGYEHNFIMNPRKRADAGTGVVEPLKKSWNDRDGWRRADPPRQRVAPSQSDGKVRERAKRPQLVGSMVEAALIGRKMIGG
jgi:hypothetical protein